MKKILEVFDSRVFSGRILRQEDSQARRGVISKCETTGVKYHLLKKETPVLIAKNVLYKGNKRTVFFHNTMLDTLVRGRQRLKFIAPGHYAVCTGKGTAMA